MSATVDPAVLQLAIDLAALLRRPHTPPDPRPAPAPAGVLVVAHARYVTLKFAAQLTGSTEKALRRKIESGKWIEWREYRRDPDGRIHVDMRGMEQWIESGRKTRKVAPVNTRIRRPPIARG